MNRHSRLLSPVLATLAVVAGCGAGQAVRPADPTAAGALGEGGGGSGLACSSAPSYAEPLVVDWRTNDQLELTLAMQKGVALVSYDCKSIHLVKGCTVAGQYAFTPVPTVLEEAVQINDADEVKASLPFSGASLSGAVSRGASIDIALAYVGKRSAIQDSIPQSALVGPDCAQATHFIRGATVGAFTMATGTKGETRAVADIFGAGASGSSSSSKARLNSAGDVSTCKGITSGAGNPPEGCAAVVRLELVQISGQAGSGGVDEGVKPPPLGNTCPDGFVPANGRCARKADGAAGGYRCDPGNLDECKEQCDRGNADSCYNAGVKLIVGAEVGGAREKQAIPLLQKACKAQIGRACFWLGAIDRDTPDGDAQTEAGEYGKKACDLLDAWGCLLEAATEQGIDPAKRFQLRKKSCDLGYNTGCVYYADDLLSGADDGVPKNPTEAARVYGAACDAGEKQACERLISAYKNSRDLKDPAKADDVKTRACQRGVKLYGCPR